MRVHEKITTGLMALALFATVAGAAPREEEEPRSVKEFNLGKQALAIDGYDPVAYFPEGGGKPAEGDAKLELEHEGVRYRFASEKNRDLFRKNPARFEPAFGGWCAWAMAKDKQVDVDPESFLIQDGRLLLFYKGLFNNTRKKWEKGEPEQLLPRADGHWKERLRRRDEAQSETGSPLGTRSGTTGARLVSVRL